MTWLHPKGTSDSAKGVSLVVVVDPLSKDGLGSLEQVRAIEMHNDLHFFLYVCMCLKVLGPGVAGWYSACVH